MDLKFAPNVQIGRKRRVHIRDKMVCLSGAVVTKCFIQNFETKAYQQQASKQGKVGSD